MARITDKKSAVFAGAREDLKKLSVRIKEDQVQLTQVEEAVRRARGQAERRGDIRHADGTAGFGHDRQDRERARHRSPRVHSWRVCPS